ncbi:MAG TPA: phosphonoacetate hydrolase [Hyphomicrobiaceae bacterium]|nr:phosphonoacetate hydrolase [Hyphomicrobiaceae bacterium]
MAEVIVNGRAYRTPEGPTAVICFDGCDPAYIARGLADGILPNIAAMRETGFLGEADAAIPTFTNPNNACIVTGVPPAVHGISGNYYLDRETGEERMITDGALMRCGTILAAMARAGVPTAAVTAKDKLRLMLSRGLDGIAFSSEYADRATLAENGIGDVEAMVGRPKPDQYSADLSLYVLDAGVRLLERRAATLLYLSLSDFVQHAHAPGTPEADAFNRAVDARIGALAAAGAVVGVVADHGMNDKSHPGGSPNVVFLEEELNRRFGAGAVRVICPITDPFVRHHGALGSFVRVYRRKDTISIEALMEATRALPGVELVLDGPAAAERFELPPDLEGDIVALGDTGTVLGATRADHDLSGLAGHRLRSHGGLAEQRVPFMVSRRLRPDYLAARRGKLRNFDIFDAVLNGVA